MASKSDLQIAGLAAGFTLGFGFLTVWEAIKQTQRNRNPLRSVYIYMIWGEIVANLLIGILGWLFLNGIIGDTVPVLFLILLCWVFEIQLLMQIIINRIALIAEHRSTTNRLKWGTAIVITLINIAVFCIFIPAHLNPPVNQTYVLINKYWDRTSKCLILIVDAGLNYYFLRTVKIRLVKYHGLVKYAPLVSFNARLMVVSIAMDVMLIGLMSLPNQTVFIQFHPVTYIVKLNIEMSMASLITRLARGDVNSRAAMNSDSLHTSSYHNHIQSHTDHNTKSYGERTSTLGPKPKPFARRNSGPTVQIQPPKASNPSTIQRHTEIGVTFEPTDEEVARQMESGKAGWDDDVPLRYMAKNGGPHVTEQTVWPSPNSSKSSS